MVNLIKDVRQIAVCDRLIKMTGQLASDPGPYAVGTDIGRGGKKIGQFLRAVVDVWLIYPILKCIVGQIGDHITFLYFVGRYQKHSLSLERLNKSTLRLLST